MRQQRNQDSSSIYRPKDSPSNTPDGPATTQHVQFANPECVPDSPHKVTPIHRNLSSPSALHSPKNNSQQAPPTPNGYSSSKVDTSLAPTNGQKRNSSSNQAYHSTVVDAQPPSTYENLPKPNEYTNAPKNYDGYVKPSSPLKSAGSLVQDRNIVPIVLSPTANSLKSKSIVTTTKVTR